MTPTLYITPEDGRFVPRKTRKELVLIDEEQEQEQRIAACRRLEVSLHRSWQTSTDARRHTLHRPLTHIVWRFNRGSGLPVGAVISRNLVEYLNYFSHSKKRAEARRPRFVSILNKFYDSADCEHSAHHKLPNTLEHEGLAQFHYMLLVLVCQARVCI